MHIHAVIRRSQSLLLVPQHPQRIDVQGICIALALPDLNFIRDCSVLQFQQLFLTYSQQQIDAFRRVRRIRT